MPHLSMRNHRPIALKFAFCPSQNTAMSATPPTSSVSHASFAASPSPRLAWPFRHGLGAHCTKCQSMATGPARVGRRRAGVGDMRCESRADTRAWPFARSRVVVAGVRILFGCRASFTDAGHRRSSPPPACFAGALARRCTVNAAHGSVPAFSSTKGPTSFRLINRSHFPSPLGAGCFGCFSKRA